MSTQQLIAEIERLPLDERERLLDDLTQRLRQERLRQTMSMAAEALESEYRKGGELTVFTEIDLDTFYETR